MNKLFPVLTLASALAMSACGSNNDGKKDDDGKKGDNDISFTGPLDALPSSLSFAAIDTPITSAPVTEYKFVSTQDANKDSIFHNGQTLRQILILDMNTKIKEYTAKNAAATVKADMEFFLDDNGTTKIADSDIVFRPKDTSGSAVSSIAVRSGEINVGLANDDRTIVSKYGEVGSAKLRNKIAGNDKEEHLIGGKLLGWAEGMDADPTASELVDYFVTQLEAEVKTNPQATVPTIGGEVDVDVAYVDGKGRDYTQLLQKLLWGAITFSQGTTDYLQGDFATLNTLRSNGLDTEAEHDWDEAFGYFGAAANYASYTDEEISAKQSKNDVDSDASSVNLSNEYSFAASVNCAKRDKGSQTGTNFTQQAFDAFLTGRHTLSQAAQNAPTNLTDDQLATVNQAVKQAAQVWEQCIAATTIHYINDTNTELQAFIDGQGKFADVAAYRKFAKYWSEMKGFALNLQFSPESPFRQSADTLKAYKAILKVMGDEARFSSVAEATAYKTALTAARDLMGKAYGFDPSDVANW